jgi:hypothetical protein
MAELAEPARVALSGIRDAEAMRRACERMDRMREEVRKKHGILDIAAPPVALPCPIASPKHFTFVYHWRLTKAWAQHLQSILEQRPGLWSPICRTSSACVSVVNGNT